MFSSPAIVAVVWLAVSAAAAAAQDPQPPAPAPAPALMLRSITVAGAKELSPSAVRDAAGVREGEPLTITPERVADRVREAYRDEGYSFARVTTVLDAESGALDIAIDEGAIDGVSFEGVDVELARTFAREFALRAGDIFNSRRARRALDTLLRPTRGAVRPGRLYPHSVTSSDDLVRRRGTFDLVDRDGKRILIVGLRESVGRFRIVPDLGEREDWFSSVDGFVPSLGMGIAVFDHDRFNHTFVAGHLSYKFGPDRAGYALGFERPLFGGPRVFVGGELHDLTASDDQWQVSSIEASLAAVGARRSFRDYYRRQGVQINGAIRIHPQVEALVAWRGERQTPLDVTSDFSFWRDDEAFRPNAAGADGRLNAIVIGASVDGRGFDRESLEASYRRHQLETPFGERLGGLERGHEPPAVWRIDWTSEISEPGAFGSDFDFRRHIVTGRTRLAVSEHQVFAARAIGGWSGGVLPPQRQFAIGGIGSVHGYDFKAQTGDSLALLNLEYEVGWRGGVKAIGFFDAGRVTNTFALDPHAVAPWLKGVGFGFGVSDCRVEFGYRTDAVPSSLQVLVRLGRSF
jgi:surface antigen-like variable number repeat protein/surface antigen Omp85-like protein